MSDAVDRRGHPQADAQPGLELETSAAVEQGNVRTYLDADRTFHLELLTRAGSLDLADVVMRLYGIRSEAGLARQRESVAEHYSIIHMVQNGGHAGIAALMKTHIMTWQPVFLDALLARQGH